MPTYILLLTLTPEGRARMLEDAENLRRAEAAIRIPGVSVMGVYGVLGEYDFVSILEAPDNDAAARFSLDLGVRAGAHITTLPAIPITRFETVAGDSPPELETGVTPGLAQDAPEAGAEQQGGPPLRAS